MIDGVGGEVLSEALGALAMGGSLTTLGYAADRKATIDVTNLIWKQASIKSFILFGQPQADAWKAIVPLLRSGAIKPIVAKTVPLTEAADALRYLVDGHVLASVLHNLTGVRLVAHIGGSGCDERRSAPAWSAGGWDRRVRHCSRTCRSRLRTQVD